MLKKSVFLLIIGCWLSAVGTAHAQFGKNNVRYNQLTEFYESYRFDVWHSFDTDDPVQKEYLREVVANLENARDWMSGQRIFGHNIEKRIPIFFYKTHTDMESSNLVGGFLSEGTGAFVESARKRMVLKGDFSRPLGRAIGVHELAHEFQFDIYDPGLIQKIVGSVQLPNGYFEGCAEFIAGLYDPHTRDYIRRREQRAFASNPKSLPTWIALNSGQNNPYTMWSMIPEFLEAKFSAGVAFCTQPLKNKIGLGEFIYDVAKGELGNPDVNSEKFDQRNRHYWGMELGFELNRINRPKPYEENDNFKGRTATPYGHPYPVLSPMLSCDGRQIATFTVQSNGIALVRYQIPEETAYRSRVERARAKKDGEKKPVFLNTGRDLIKNLTPQLPPVPWEYLVVQGLETWSFNGSDGDWSCRGNKIAFFARINRDHALVIIDAETGEVLRKIELELPVLDQAFSPSFTPDGEWVYFSATKNMTRNIYAVYVGDSKTKTIIYQVTDNGRFGTAPAVSPDGNKVVYIGLDGDFQHLFLRDIKTGFEEQLTFGAFNDISPSWSDDGSTLVYVSDETDRIDNLYTFDLATRTVSQWTEFIGGTETPVFARDSLNKVYYTVFRDDDQFGDIIYHNHEIFEAEFKKPLRQYTATDTKEPLKFVFNPDRDLFRFKLDSNQLLNPRKPPEQWNCNGGNISFGTSTYWGMFGQSYFGCSNMLETKRHVGLFAFSGSFRLFDYSYFNQEKRSSWRLGAHQYQLPLYYQFYDIAARYPKQLVFRGTWLKESSFDATFVHPLNKFNRLEFFSKLSHLSYNFFGFSVSDLDENFFESLQEEFEEFTDNDIRVLKFLKNSNGSNASFGAAYVRDTVLHSGNTGLSGMPAPFHGNALNAQIKVAPPLGREFKGYVSVNVSARMYRHLGSSSTFAVRGDFMTTSRANGDFMLLCGPERLRGCEYGSIVGNQVGYTSAELRFPIPGTYVLYQNIRGLFFADGAIAKFSDDKLPAQKLKAYGFGIQYVIPIAGLPMQTVWTRNNGKWKPSFYVSLNW